MEDPVQAISDALAAIAGITDRKARARAATEALELLPEANQALAALRRDDIRALHRQDRMSYRKIAAAIGIHFTRVKQIDSGAPTGNSARARAARERDQNKPSAGEHGQGIQNPRGSPAATPARKTPAPEQES